jgi:hypothetical protein
MRLLFDFKHNISWLNAWCLVTFAAELDLVAALNTSVNVNVKNLPFYNGLLAIALLALVLLANDFSLSVTIRADSLKSLNHGTHLAHHSLHAVSVTTSTLLDSTLFAASAIALGANHGFL